MPRLARCLLLIALLMSGAASAGPWPREVKGVFMSLSTERDRDGNSHAGLYGEYGLTPRNTLGVEVGRSNAGETSALIWLQRARDPAAGPDRWAMSLGAGVVERNGTAFPVARAGAAWGRGLDAVPGLRRIPRGGWLSAEAQLNVAGAMKDEDELRELAGSGASGLGYLTPEAEVKAALTLGWHATTATMLVNQMRFEEREDTGFSSELASSLVYDLGGPARIPAKIELGVTAPLSGPGEQAVKLGTWVEF